MNLFMKSRMFLAGMLFLSFIFSGYKPVGPEAQKYSTSSEKQKLFKGVGCKYSNVLRVEYPHFNKLHAKESEVYLENKNQYDAYAFKYAKAVKEKLLAPMYLLWINDIVGYGVFAAQDIKRGDFIGEYFGILREVKSAPDNLDYAWYYTLDAIDGQKLVIDGKDQGNELRFINHADDPNTIRIDVLGKDGVFHVVYKACKDIKKDEQLTVSYGSGYFTSRKMKVQPV